MTTTSLPAPPLACPAWCTLDHSQVEVDFTAHETTLAHRAGDNSVDLYLSLTERVAGRYRPMPGSPRVVVWVGGHSSLEVSPDAGGVGALESLAAMLTEAADRLRIIEQSGGVA